MLQVINITEQDGVRITEYTMDGETVSHIAEEVIGTPPENNVIQPSIEEQILTENQYQTAILEMNMIGGA